MTWEHKVRALAAEARSPSSVLALHAADILRDIATDDPELLAEAARAVVRALPALAAVVSVANMALRAVEVLGLGSVGGALESLRQGLEADRHAAATALCARIESPVCVVTMSANVVVAESIQALHRQALLERVICAESRPLLEGTAFARWLAAQGCPTTLATDAALSEHLRPGAVFVVGTEAILPHHIVHHVGTRLLAAWSALAGVPRYVVATRDRFYPPELLGCFAVPLLPPSELLREPPAGLQAQSPAYDLSPRRLWTEIFVGGQPVDVAAQRGDHKVARGLLQLVS